MQTASSTSIQVAERAEPASLHRLLIRDFRNFRELRLDLPEAGAMIIGPNGSGKTNLLEAIYYLEVFRSFRGARDSDLIRFGEDVFRIEATIQRDGGTEELAAAFQKTGRRKKVEREGAEVDRITGAIGAFGAVVFDLDDAGLVSGSPGRRRRFLDILLSLVVPGYVADLQRYRAVLAQRNEALRAGRDEVVDAWTEGLIVPGAKLMAARDGWARRRADGFRGYHQQISGGAGASLEYETSLSAPQEDVGWEMRFRSGLEASRTRDFRRGFTTVGPHRDDLAIRAEVDSDGPERDLRSFGSGGQKRTAAIALRLTEADSLREANGRDPVYLLDDVFAELDRERAERVFRLLDEGRSGQVFFTAPKPADMPFRDGALARWRISDGALLDHA
ncbi:MAG: DNA replication and repair protein RecF [marine benthic group bacterium]|nr:DNA replication and repair protein RecF [Candidatus Carthagonibacter metallireducens]MCL7985756.1 DNA replication and repair protein RecF [Gemmatimonadota bacterium]